MNWPDRTKGQDDEKKYELNWPDQKDGATNRNMNWPDRNKGQEDEQKYELTWPDQRTGRRTEIWTDLTGPEGQGDEQKCPTREYAKLNQNMFNVICAQILHENVLQVLYDNVDYFYSQIYK